jgi:hypothetical protein
VLPFHHSKKEMALPEIFACKYDGRGIYKKFPVCDNKNGIQFRLKNRKRGWNEYNKEPGGNSPLFLLQAFQILNISFYSYRSTRTGLFKKS